MAPATVLTMSRSFLTKVIPVIYETVKAKEAIDWSPHNHAYVNPYNGCPTGCPFCFWLSQPGWEGRIQIRENLPDLLKAELKNWMQGEYIYFGSVCDPFMEAEREYGLSRKCLELIKEGGMPLLITTSATCDVILQNMDLLLQMKDRVILVVELSRIPLIEQLNRGGVHTGIANANLLREHGLEVWATLSPILPHITDLDVVLEQLNSDIPVYVDSLLPRKGTIQGNKVLEWINRDYPELSAVYEKIVDEQDTSFYDNLLMAHKNDPRVKTFPFQLPKR